MTWVHHHSNQREPHYPSYLIHQRLKITKLKHLRQGEFLAWEYRTSHTQHRINTTSSGNKHRKVAMGSHNFFGCYHNHEIKKTTWEREAKRTGTRKKSKRLFGVSFFLFNLGACLKPKTWISVPTVYISNNVLTYETKTRRKDYRLYHTNMLIPNVNKNTETRRISDGRTNRHTEKR